MKPTLLVLAAGMGSRYGGLKQIDPVGPHGEFIIDYSLYDAVRAGFGKVVFVIRRDIEGEFRRTIASRVPSDLTIEYAFQELDRLPDGYAAPPERKKPWGTGHAIWCARQCVDAPMLVINADDFYGAAAYAAAGRFIGSLPPGSTDDYFMVGYRLRDTVSPHGPVARGVCSLDAEGLLAGVTETTSIAVEPSGEIHAPAAGGQQQRFTGDEIVSMNMWGFQPSIFERLDGLLREFLDERREAPGAEFYIPEAVATLIDRGTARAKVLTAEGSPWFGVTYAEDKPLVAGRIRALVDSGAYPSPLWTQRGAGCQPA